MPNATVTPAAGVGVVASVFGLTNIPRTLYLHANIGVEPQAVSHRSLYVYTNEGVELHASESRSLYTHENVAIDELTVAARDLYVYEVTRDGEVFPWLMKIDPTEQYRGGQVDLYGDGFGELVDITSQAAITTSSVLGANVGENTRDRAGGEWISTSDSAAWIRFTFAAARKIVAVSLEGIVSTDEWGRPEFRFSDGGAVVVGGVNVPTPLASDYTGEIPVGMARVLYQLPAPRTTEYVEVRVASGGSGVNRGLGEVWIFEDLDEAAETSTVALGIDPMGIVAWSNRSPGLHPANGGQPITPAATVTVPATGESGLVVVTEST